MSEAIAEPRTLDAHLIAADKAAATAARVAQVSNECAALIAELDHAKNHEAALLAKKRELELQLHHLVAGSPQFQDHVRISTGVLDELRVIGQKRVAIEKAHAESVRTLAVVRADAKRADLAAQEAAIRADSETLTPLLLKQLEPLLPRIAEHAAMVHQFNRARGFNPAALWPAPEAQGEPVTVWGEGSPDPIHPGFWEMLRKAYEQSNRKA